MKARDVSLTAVFGALYASLVVLFLPISFFEIQVRVADALIPLSIVFGWPVILGVTLGNIIANFFGGLGVIDIIGGTLANFTASYLAYKTRNTVIPAITIALIVGSYLSLLFDLPLWMMVLSVLVGSLISVTLLGTMLIKAIRSVYK